MPRDRGSFVERSVLPPRMAGTFAHEFAAVRPQMPEQFVNLHTAIRSSVYRSPADDKASSRLSSSASRSVTLRLSMSSSRVASWQLTPGTSSIHPIHQSPSCLTTAVYSLFISCSSPVFRPHVGCSAARRFLELPPPAGGRRQRLHQIWAFEGRFVSMTALRRARRRPATGIPHVEVCGEPEPHRFMGWIVPEHARSPRGGANATRRWKLSVGGELRMLRQMLARAEDASS